MSRRRTRSPEYRARRQRRQFGRHYWIDEPAPPAGTPEAALRGARLTEYRRGHIVSVDIEPPTPEVTPCTFSY